MLRTLITVIIGIGHVLMSSCPAQDLPDTDILIYSFQPKNKSWKLIKKHDSLIYENQLHFTDNANYLFVKKYQSYTSVFSSKVKSKKEILLLKDTMNLFSPIQINKYEIQLIVQDKQNKQFIARYKFEKKNLSKKILLQSQMAGYHTFMNPDTLVFYRVDEGEHQMMVFLNDTTFLTAGKNPASPVYKSGPYEFLWMHKSEKGNYIFEYSIPLRKNRLIMKVDETDYFFLHSNKHVMLVRNGHIECYDLQGKPVTFIPLPETLMNKTIKRLYLSPNGKIFAFVILKN
jgi:hypothetical protein